MFNTEIYPSTLVYIFICIVLITIVSIRIWLARKRCDRSYYIKHLGLLLFVLIYNIVGGLFPDPGFGFNLMAQNIFIWTVGLPAAFYYFAYLKNEYNLVFFKGISLEAIGIFTLFMFIVLFILPYIVFQSLDVSRPLFLSFFLIVLLFALATSAQQQYKKYKDHTSKLFKIHCINGILGFIGLISLPATILLFGDNQLIEHTCFSLGCFILSVDFFLYHKRNREIKNSICLDKLSTREIEVFSLLLNEPHLKYAEISQKLNISEKTLSSHLCNIYKKTGLRNKKEIEELSKSSPGILAA